MKLYTEEQVLQIIGNLNREYFVTPQELLEEMELTPIELPSDEEIKKVLIQYNDYLFTFIDKDEIGINVETEDVIKYYEQTYGDDKQ